MKRRTALLSGALFVFCITAPALADTAPPADSRPSVGFVGSRPSGPSSSAWPDIPVRAGTAPADEYFGPQKMSVLGVRNVIERAELFANAGAAPDSHMSYDLTSAEAAIRAWERRYPNDYWLPIMYARLQRAYARMPGPDAKYRAADLASALVVHFPRSREAQAMRELIVRAFAAPPPVDPSAPVAANVTP